MVELIGSLWEVVLNGKSLKIVESNTRHAISHWRERKHKLQMAGEEAKIVLVPVLPQSQVAGPMGKPVTKEELALVEDTSKKRIVIQ
jgi:hypothetical protein